MDVVILRTAPLLPSGLASLDIPMKVYRDRLRPANVPWFPLFTYAGDMSDTQRLERWLSFIQQALKGLKQ